MPQIETLRQFLTKQTANVELPWAGRVGKVMHKLVFPLPQMFRSVFERFCCLFFIYLVIF